MASQRPTMTPQEFVAKWRPSSLKERSGSQEHFIDLFLWALQRLYERGEGRFGGLLWPRFRLVRDIDDSRQATYGVYYQKKTPLCAASLVGHPGV